jgi:ribose transport system substrate-binding protein
MNVTIRDIADMAGVSIATVSHVINKTRFVNPELVEKVEQAIFDTGYIDKLNKKKTNHYKVGKYSEIAFVVPNTFSIVYSHLAMELSNLLTQEGFTMSSYLSDGDCLREKHILNELMSNRRISGIILVPASNESRDYDKLIKSGIPFICLERTFSDVEVDSVLSDNVKAIYQGTEHLIKCGHENIALLLEESNQTTVEDRLNGYKNALADYKIPFRSQFILNVNLKTSSESHIKKLMKSGIATAYIAGGNTLTLKLLKCADEIGLECPSEISIVGFGDDEWCERINPPLTTLKQNTVELSQLAVKSLLDKIAKKPQRKRIFEIVPISLTVRKSTQNIARGPFGEMAVYPEQNALTEEEIENLRRNDYTVGISFHYSGDEWTKLHEQAIKETLNRYGIRLLSVTDAHFDPDLQITQLESLIMQKANAIIAVPTDEVRTAQKFKEIAKKSKLILINNMPSGFEPDDYACWISVNERENGQNAAKILVDHFRNQKNVKIGMLTHGTPFFATKQRDFFAEQTLMGSSNINIVARRDFYTIDNTYDVCKHMIQENPDIDGLYITWERPALKAIQALEDMKREDIVISTTDLDYNIASYLAREKMVIGLSSQRPFEQGVAVAIATAKALLGKNEHKCIGVPPYTVLRRNLSKSWHELIKTKVPEFFEE